MKYYQPEFDTKNLERKYKEFSLYNGMNYPSGRLISTTKDSFKILINFNDCSMAVNASSIPYNTDALRLTKEEATKLNKVYTKIQENEQKGKIAKQTISYKWITEPKNIATEYVRYIPGKDSYKMGSYERKSLTGLNEYSLNVLEKLNQDIYFYGNRGYGTLEIEYKYVYK